jgi:hypothetical protein
MKYKKSRKIARRKKKQQQKWKSKSFDCFFFKNNFRFGCSTHYIDQFVNGTLSRLLDQLISRSDLIIATYDRIIIFRAIEPCYMKHVTTCIRPRSNRTSENETRFACTCAVHQDKIWHLDILLFENQDEPQEWQV